MNARVIKFEDGSEAEIWANGNAYCATAEKDTQAARWFHKVRASEVEEIYAEMEKLDKRHETAMA